MAFIQLFACSAFSNMWRAASRRPAYRFRTLFADQAVQFGIQLKARSVEG